MYMSGHDLGKMKYTPHSHCTLIAGFFQSQNIYILNHDNGVRSTPKRCFVMYIFDFLYISNHNYKSSFSRDLGDEYNSCRTKQIYNKINEKLNIQTNT